MLLTDIWIGVVDRSENMQKLCTGNIRKNFTAKKKKRLELDTEI